MASMARFAEAFPVILDLLVRGALLLAAAGVVSLVLRRAAAATRHVVWTAAMAGLLVLPLAGVLAPDLRVTVPVPATAVQGPALHSTVVGGPAQQAAQGPFPGEGSKVSAMVEARGEVGAAGAGAVADPVIREAASGIPLAAWLTAAWLVGVLVLLAPLAASVVAIRLVGARLPVFDDSRISRRASLLAKRVGVRRAFRLLEGAEGAMPMTFGARNPTIVLPAEARSWPAERLESVLLHELAHIRRRDTVTQMVARVAHAIHWVNPLAWLAIRRLEAEREHACDDMALARGARASAYAAELLALARRYRTSRATGSAALAMARPGRLSQRLQAVLDDGRRRGEIARGTAWKAAALAAAAVLPLAALAPAGAGADRPGSDLEPPGGTAAAADLSPARPSDTGEPGLRAVLGDIPESAALMAFAPAFQDASCVTEPGEWESVQSRSNNDRQTVVLERPGCQLEVRFEGEIEFDPAGTLVARMSRDARLSIEEDDGRMTRSLEVRPGDGGRPVFAYREDRSSQEFDAAARAWYQAVMLGLSRTTGFLAEARVQVLLDDGGVEAVLRELGQVHTDLAYAKHVQALLERASLDEAETRALIRGSADRVDSDHYLAGILQAVAEHQPMSGGTLGDFVQATGRLDSDHYRTQALSTALASDMLSNDQVAMVLQAAAEMDSDHYRSEILVSVADRYALEPGFRQLYLDATAAMGSDHYRTEVLNRLLDRNDLGAEEKAAVLESASMLESDHYRTELLHKVAQAGMGEPGLHEAFFRVAAGLGSDHYYREAMGLLIREPLSDDMLVAVLEASARNLDSDHYKADLLLAVLEGRAVDGRVREAFIAAMDSMDSEHYRGRVASALLRAEAR